MSNQTIPIVPVPEVAVMDKRLSTGAYRLYCQLRRRWERYGQEYVPHQELADDMSVSLRSLGTYLKELEDQGYIRSTPFGPARTRIYRPI